MQTLEHNGGESEAIRQLTGSWTSYAARRRANFGKPSYLTLKLQELQRLKTLEHNASWRGLPGEVLTGDAVLADFPNTLQRDGRALYEALRTGNPHSILKAVIGTIRYDGNQYVSEVLPQLPASTFSEILRSIHPKHFVNRFNKAHQEISPAGANGLGLLLLGGAAYDQDYRHFCSIFLTQVSAIIETRRRSSPLSLSDYKFILDSARVTGNKSVADYAWNELLQQGISPDVDCYNSYMETKCLGDLLKPTHRYKLQVTPAHLSVRTREKPPTSFRGHGIGPETGIKSRISKIFNRMIKSGVLGNEKTFCMMIIALAREGDLAGVESVLKRVWNINVHALMSSSDNSELAPPRRFTRNSPFYPSKNLIFTLAHAYSINGSIPIALRLVDHVSRSYSLDITSDVWYELLQWTYVLSTSPTTGTHLPPEAVANLFSTMTSEPYNVIPTMQMYDLLIRSLITRQRFREAEYRMEEARFLHKSGVRRLVRNLNVFNRRLARSCAIRGDQAHRNIAYLQLRNRINRLYMRRWVRRFIKESSVSLRSSMSWGAQELPAFLQRWNLFLPSKLEYEVSSGKVRFWSGSPIANAVRIQRFDELRNIPRIPLEESTLKSHGFFEVNVA
ncbi:mitochondrial ATPase expression-domain-containing protein [Xylogone sp. PMI_703]|nr:mitochondrial ATPase expression-domain-containing protein [Xylogone sp. PMI_703]